MGRTKSTILEHPLLKTKDTKKMPKRMTLAEAKGNLKDCKTAVRETKRDVTENQKAFVTEPNKQNAKDYRDAVSDHIFAVNAQLKSEERVAKLTPTE